MPSASRSPLYPRNADDISKRRLELRVGHAIPDSGMSERTAAWRASLRSTSGKSRRVRCVDRPRALGQRYGWAWWHCHWNKQACVVLAMNPTPWKSQRPEASTPRGTWDEPRLDKGCFQRLTRSGIRCKACARRRASTTKSRWRSGPTRRSCGNQAGRVLPDQAARPGRCRRRLPEPRHRGRAGGSRGRCTPLLMLDGMGYPRAH